MSENKQDDSVQTEWVYMGVRVDSKAKKTFYWADANNLDNTHAFDKNIITASIGGIYSVWTTKGGSSVFTAGAKMPRYLRRIADKVMYCAWVTKDDAARQVAAVKSLNAKAARECPLDDVLKPIRQIAKNLTSAEKRALVAKVAEIILSPW